MDQNLTLTEQHAMRIFRILETYSVRMLEKLEALEIKKLLRDQLPNFLKAMDEGTKNKLLNDKGKEMSFDEIWDMVGRMTLEYMKKNSNAFKD